MKTLLQVELRQPDALPPQTRVTLERVLATVQSMSSTTQALLDLAQGQHLAAHDVIDLRAIVREEWNATSAGADARGLSVAIHPGEAFVVGDPQLLRDLVSNLLRNAVVHNNDGGLIEITTDSDATGLATLTVSNTGTLIPTDRVPLLTEPFYRARLRTAGGHGLGLAIVAAIADAHRADLHLTAREAGGLTVVVVFPELDS